VASAYASGDVDANTRTTLLRQIISSRPTSSSSLEDLPTPSSSRPPPLATYSVIKRKIVMPKPTVMEEGVDPLEEIDPYPGDDEVKEVEVDPLADPLGGVSPPRVEEGPVSPPRADEGTASNLGAVILG